MWTEGGLLSETAHTAQSAPKKEKALGGRFPLLAPGALSGKQRNVYDAVAGPPRGDGPFLVVDDDGHLAGPFNALLYSPDIGHAVQALGATLRFGGTLPDRTRELLICAVALELDSDYEWYAHSRVAAVVGIMPEELDGLRTGKPIALDSAEQAALSLAQAMLRGNTVDAGIHADALSHYGHDGVTEIAVLVGYYRMLSGLLAVGDVPAPDQQADTS